MKKKALIFGITGQDGSYLANFLLSKNYVVHGIKRRSSSHNTYRVDSIYEEKMRELNKNTMKVEDEKNKLKLVKMKLDKIKVDLELEKKQLEKERQDIISSKAENLDLDVYFDH